MTRDEVVSKIYESPEMCSASFKIGTDVFKHHLTNAIPSLLWIAKSEREIHSFLYDWFEEKEIEIPPDWEVELAHSLFEWLRGDV